MDEFNRGKIEENILDEEIQGQSEFEIDNECKDVEDSGCSFPSENDSEPFSESEKEDILSTSKNSNLVRGFICPYLGIKSFGTCQDSLYADTENKFFSVVDGVSEGMGQFYFVHLLSKYNPKNPDVRISKDDLKQIYMEWHRFQRQLIEEDRMNYRIRNMYDKGKIAHSTYIRLKFHEAIDDESNIGWNCAVLGDSALIHVQKDESNIEVKHVVMSTESVRESKFIYSDLPNQYFAFDEAPDQTDEEGTWLENEACMTGTCQQGDFFILATDHVSAWLLADPSKTKERINLLFELQTQEAFQELMDSERDSDSKTSEPNMGNDDVTAMIIEIVNPKCCDFMVTAIMDPRKKFEEQKMSNNNNTIKN